MVLGAIAAVGLVIVLALAFVFLRKRPAKVEMAAAQLATSGGTAGAPATGNQLEGHDAREKQLESETLSRIKLPTNTRKTEVLVRHIRDAVTNDASNATNVLRTWISDVEGRRT